MKISSYIFISLFALAAGTFFMAFHHDWIIIRIPMQKTTEKAQPVRQKNERKQATLHFWHHETWHTEVNDILFCQDIAQTAQHLVQAWLTVLEEEGLGEKKVPLQSVLICPSGLCYISLSRNPFSSEETTWEKLMWVEGLLKTLRNNTPAIKQVQLLVNHKQLHDPHLDFASPWPVTGWIS